MQNKYTSQLIAACKTGNLNKIKELVDKNLVDLNQVDPFGLSPIYYAVIEGHEDVVLYLISHNVSFDISVPSPIPGVIKHSLLEDCLGNQKKGWQDRLKMAKLLLDNGYNKYHTVENGSEHLLDIAIMNTQQSGDFSLLKFILKNFDTISMKIQVLKNPVIKDPRKKYALSALINESSYTSTTSIFNLTTSIPKLSDNLIVALNEAIMEDELQNVPLMIFRLGVRLDILDTLLNTVLDKCDDVRFFQKRRAIALQNNVNLKTDVLLGIQKKLKDIFVDVNEIQLLIFDSRISSKITEYIGAHDFIHNEIDELYQEKINSILQKTDFTKPDTSKDSDLHLVIRDPHDKSSYVLNEVAPGLKVHTIPNADISDKTTVSSSDKNVLMYTAGSMLLIPVVTYSIRKSINFVKKLIAKSKEPSIKDRTIHAIQHNTNYIAYNLIEQLPTKIINEPDKLGNTLINYAFSKNNLGVLKALVNKGAIVTMLDFDNRNLLMKAIEKKYVPLAMYLIDKVDLSTKDTKGKDSLMYAIENNMPIIAKSILDTLIQKKSYLYNKDLSGRNALIYAIQFNMDYVANKLLDNLCPTDIDELDKYSNILINYAVSRNNFTIVKTLLDKGATVNILDSCNKNLLMKSLEKKYTQLSMYLIDKVNLFTRDNMGKNALMYAIENNVHVVAKILLDRLMQKKSYLCAKDSSGKNVLMYAIQYHINDIANTLMRFLAVNEYDNNGYTPFDYACIYNNKEIIIEFLKKSPDLQNINFKKDNFYNIVKKSLLSMDTANVYFLNEISTKCFSVLKNIINNDLHIKHEDSRKIFIFCCKNNLNFIAISLLRKGNILMDSIDDRGETVLSYAVKNNNVPISRYLIEHGADIEVRDENKKTLLMLAIKNTNVPLVKQLVVRGSDVLAKDKYRKTVLDYASTSSNPEIKDIIQNAININSTRHLLSKNISKKSSHPVTNTLNLCSESTKLSLMYASARNDLSTMTKLLTFANVDTCDEYKKTCLMYACENGSLDAVDYLIKNNASLNILDSNGKSALYYACKNNHLDIVKKLLENGVSLGVNKPDFGFYVACQKGYFDIVKILVDNDMTIDPIHNVKSPLMFACEGGHLDVVKYLVDNGANTNLVLDLNGYSVMDFANKSRNLDVIRYIQKKTTSIKLYNCTPTSIKTRYR